LIRCEEELADPSFSIDARFELWPQKLTAKFHAKLIELSSEIRTRASILNIGTRLLIRCGEAWQSGAVKAEPQKLTIETTPKLTGVKTTTIGTRVLTEF
jgi:hypothetical protein